MNSLSLPRPSSFATHWNLSPSIVHLNHGSFGACPTEVLLFQQELQRRIEENTMQFFAREHGELLRNIREVIGEFIQAPARDIALVDNATQAVNTVFRSLPWQSSDEILITNHAYNACRNTVDFIAERHRIKIKIINIPFPIQSPDTVVELVLEAITPNTKLAFLDHITSPTALVLPIKQLVAKLSQLGIDTFIDGAHAPGMLPLNLTDLGATYYTGNFHKWLCTPKGSAFLYVAPSRQELIRPLCISHGANVGDQSKFRNEFDWQGTSDPTAHLAIPAAIEVLSNLFEGGLPSLMSHNRALAIEAQAILAEALQIDIPAPKSMLGSMATLPLPTRPIAINETDPFPQTLLEHWKTDIGFTHPAIAPLRCFRVSCQAYNSLEQYQYLAQAILQMGDLSS